MSTVNNDAGDRSMTQEEHYANYLRYADAWHGRQQPFTASQQEAPPQYLPYAQYPKTTAQEAGGISNCPVITSRQRRAKRTALLPPQHAMPWP